MGRRHGYMMLLPNLHIMIHFWWNWKCPTLVFPFI